MTLSLVRTFGGIAIIALIFSIELAAAADVLLTVLVALDVISGAEGVDMTNGERNSAVL